MIPITRIAGIGLTSALLIAGGVFGAETEEKPIPPGTEAPGFSLPGLDNSRQVLSYWCGKLTRPYVNNVPHVVILSFWATYCKPCQKEMPELEKFYEKHKTEHVKVFCVSLDKEGATIVDPFVKEKGYSLPILLDPYKKTAERYGVKSLPALVVIGADGIVRFSSVGYKEGTSLDKTLDEVLAAVQSGKTVAPQKAGGESVAVASDTAQSASKPAPTPKQKWQAVASIECGTAVEDVADGLGVSKDEVLQWHNDLKKAALELWGGKEQSKEQKK